MGVLADPTEDYPRSRTAWEQEVRPRVMATFRDEIYGRVPEGEVETTWRLLEEGTAGGRVRRQYAVTVHGPRGETTLTILVYLPRDRPRVPAFLGLNFLGNHATTLDPHVLRVGLDRTGETGRIHYDHLGAGPSTFPARGARRERWPFELVTDHGHAVVTACYLQVGPDTPGVFAGGPHSILAGTRADDRPADQWGAIGMWAWTMSRLLDALAGGMVPEVDPARVTAMGHSRLGKTALWAAATDERFAAAISNDSGCMGAALTRPVGETPEVLARIRPYWFARAFSERVLAGRPLPVDQHQLLACVAPRPLYVASASEDPNADPEGEFGSWAAAAQVWELYGHARAQHGFPAPGEARGGGGAPLGYHLRSGPHSVETFDWEHWLAFGDRWLAA